MTVPTGDRYFWKRRTHLHQDLPSPRTHCAYSRDAKPPWCENTPLKDVCCTCIFLPRLWNRIDLAALAQTSCDISRRNCQLKLSTSRLTLHRVSVKNILLIGAIHDVDGAFGPSLVTGTHTTWRIPCLSEYFGHNRVL
jgi:hypothetical protein